MFYYFTLLYKNKKRDNNHIMLDNKIHSQMQFYLQSFLIEQERLLFSHGSTTNN